MAGGSRNKRGRSSHKDAHGYERHNNHSNLWHRKVAYHKIYLKNRDKYPRPFSEYEVHHKDFNKSNNHPSNLAVLTPEEHIDIHIKADEFKEDFWKKEISRIKAEVSFKHELSVFFIGFIFLSVPGLLLLGLTKSNPTSFFTYLGYGLILLWLYFTFRPFIRGS